MKKQKTAPRILALAVALLAAAPAGHAGSPGVPLGPLYGQTQGPIAKAYDQDGQIAADQVLLSAVMTALANYSGRLSEERAVAQMDAYLRRNAGVNGSIRHEEDPALRTLYIQAAVAIYSDLPITAVALVTQIPYYPAHAASPYAPGMIELGSIIGEDDQEEGKSASKGGAYIAGVVKPLADQIRDPGLSTYATLMTNAFLYQDRVALVAAQSALRQHQSRYPITQRDARLIKQVQAGMLKAFAMDSKPQTREKTKGP